MRRLRGYAVQIRLYLVQDGFLHLLALAVEQLYAVVMVWVMARAYHDAAVEVVHAGDVGDARRRRHVQQIRVRARGREARGERALVHIARTAGIFPDDYLGLVLPAVVPADEAADLEGVLRREVNVGLAAETVGSKVF